jgi:molybdate transport system substrate-binding protein
MSRRFGIGAPLAALVLAACGGQASQPAGSGPTPTGVSGTVTVLAAASLTESFEALAEQLEAERADLDVVFSFGPSSGLVEQVNAGAPADILATANTSTMDVAVAAGSVDGDPQVFVRNTLALVVPAGNPGGVTGLADLARDDLDIAICEPQVPCGAASEQLLTAAGVVAKPDTLANDVKEAASLAALGEVDAALVYRTDAVAEGDAVETIDVAEADEVVNDYPVALLADAPNPEAAEVVLAAITGEPGRSILAAAGFVLP